MASRAFGTGFVAIQGGMGLNIDCRVMASGYSRAGGCTCSCVEQCTVGVETMYPNAFASLLGVGRSGVGR